MSINISTPVNQDQTPKNSLDTGPSAVAAENKPTVAAQESKQVEAEAPAVNTREVEQAVSDINEYLQNVSRDIQFRVDEALPLGRTIISVVDTETQKTIREFPSKEVLALAHRLLEAKESDSGASAEGLLFSDQA